MTDDIRRCGWVSPGSEPLALAYHDEEWGVPSRDDRHLFEMLTLEGAQSGLSWMTILRKREGYRRAFADFDAATVAGFDQRDVQRLMADASIVRNRAKIESTIENARAIQRLRETQSSLSDFLWRFVEGRPIQNRFEELAALPAETPTSRAMSRELKKQGFRFLGPTTCYAFMQAVGMVNDHLLTCYREAEIESMAMA